MNYVIVGYCPRCGAPIYTHGIWHGVTPPPSIYSCGCFSINKGYTTGTDIGKKVYTDTAGNYYIK